MIAAAIILSLQILGVHVCFLQGNIFGEVRIAAANFLDRQAGKKISSIIQKPLWGCLPCMAALWSIVLTWSFDLHLILAVCGINFIIDKLLPEQLPAE